MDYVPEETLQEFLLKRPAHRCDELTFRKLAVRILEELEEAHRQGVMNRDLTPETILISGEDSVRLLDFGIDPVPKDETSDPMLLSTRYRPPDYADDPDPTLDVYSAGCVFYEMLGGRLPFDEKGRVKGQEASPIAGVSETLKNLLLSCLDKESAKRPQLAREVLEALSVIPVYDEAMEGAPAETPSTEKAVPQKSRIDPSRKPLADGEEPAAILETISPVPRSANP